VQRVLSLPTFPTQSVWITDLLPAGVFRIITPVILSNLHYGLGQDYPDVSPPSWDLPGSMFSGERLSHLPSRRGILCEDSPVGVKQGEIPLPNIPQSPRRRFRAAAPRADRFGAVVSEPPVAAPSSLHSWVMQ
jgi:hypothetical protein